jgi:hypothetical protein
MLVAAAVVAVVAVFAGQAIGGRIWAVGLTAGLVSIPLALLVQAGFFMLGSAFAAWLGPQEIIARTSRGGVEQTGMAPLESVAEQTSPTSSKSPAT